MFQTSCRFTCRGKIPVLQQTVTVQLYKIAQEAASNAVKHGHASLISICLAHETGRLVLTITNNGTPFPENKGENHRMGLRIMNSRASMIGASLEIGSKGDDGTMVSCTLPLSNDAKVTQVDFVASPAAGTGSGTELSPSKAPSRKMRSGTKTVWQDVKRNGDLLMNSANGSP